jgi:hypothetical protein
MLICLAFVLQQVLLGPDGGGGVRMPAQLLALYMSAWLLTMYMVQCPSGAAAP